MARVTITPIALGGSYGGAVNPGTGTAADTTDFNRCALTGREILLIENTSADTAYDITIYSTANRRGRTGDLTISNLPFGERRVVGPFSNLEGWSNGGYLEFDGEHADVKFTVLTLPATL